MLHQHIPTSGSIVAQQCIPTVETAATVCSNNTSGSYGLPNFQDKRDRETDMDGPIKCSLTLERQEHAKTWAGMPRPRLLFRVLQWPSRLFVADADAGAADRTTDITFQKAIYLAKQSHSKYRKNATKSGDDALTAMNTGAALSF